MKISVALFVLIASISTAFANDSTTASNAQDLVAPVVYNRTDLTQAPAGTIVYDTNASGYYGLSLGGDPSSATSWYLLGGVGSNITTAGTSERMDRVQFGGNASATTACSSSPCTISTQSGSWISSVSRTGQGNYTLNIVNAEFSAAPVCTCSTAADTAVTICQVLTGGSSTSITIQTRTTGGLQADEGVSVICMGPH